MLKKKTRNRISQITRIKEKIGKKVRITAMTDDWDKQAALTAARDSFRCEREALAAQEERVGDALLPVVELLLSNPGKVVIAGLGKSGHIGRKIAATLNSTGTPALFLHAAEALHGDLGVYSPGDPTILISNSGSTAELVRLVPTLREFNSPLIGLLGRVDSPIGRECDCVIDASVSTEADPLGIAPTASALAALAWGDALAAALMAARGFREKDFARFHPAGQLGRNLLLRVREAMHGEGKAAFVAPTDPLREVVIAMTTHPLGAACVVDASGQLLGIVTDGDVRRTLREHDDIRGLAAQDVMTPEPVATTPEHRLADAVALMENRPSRISVLPVVAEDSKRCLGLLRLHDVYRPEA